MVDSVTPSDLKRLQRTSSILYLEELISHVKSLRILGVVALLAALGALNAGAQQIKTGFVIAMENHNWTQLANQFTGGIQQIYQNLNAPFINSLATGAWIPEPGISAPYPFWPASNERTINPSAGSHPPQLWLTRK